MSSSHIIKSQTKITKAVAKNLELLNTYSSNIQRKQSLMDTTKHLYSTRDIRTITSAVSAMDLLRPNDFKFRKEFVKMTDNIPTKLDKQKEQQHEKAEAQDAELAEAVKKVDQICISLTLKRHTGKQ